MGAFGRDAVARDDRLGDELVFVCLEFLNNCLFCVGKSLRSKVSSATAVTTPGVCARRDFVHDLIKVVAWSFSLKKEGVAAADVSDFKEGARSFYQTGFRLRLPCVKICVMVVGEYLLYRVAQVCTIDILNQVGTAQVFLEFIASKDVPLDRDGVYENRMDNHLTSLFDYFIK